MKKLFLICLILSLPVFLNAQNCEIEHVTKKILSCKCNLKEDHRAFYIISDSGLIVVDTYYFPSLTQESLDLVYSETGRKNVKCLINTHGHACHTGGNYLFRDVPRIAHDSILNQIPKIINFHLKKYVKLKNASIQDSSLTKELHDYEMLVNIPLPTTTFKDSLSLDFGDINIKLIYFGFSGHSCDETLIFIPQEKTLIIGQILNGTTFLPIVQRKCTKYDLERKIKVMSELISQDIEHILSNHQGEISKTDFIFARNYLVDLNEGIEKLKEQGLSLDDIKKEFQLSAKYPELSERHELTDAINKRNEQNIESVWNTLK